MKTEITKIKGDWIEVASDCRSTVGKPPLDHEPSAEFKRKILIAEHSPIRDISVKWTWHGIKKLGRYPLEQTQVREVHQVSALRQNRHPAR